MIGLLFILALIAAQAWSAHASNPKALLSAMTTRALEPVVLKGQSIPTLLGSNVAELSVYSFRGGTWAKIPSQIDEKNSTDIYVAIEDTLFDANDELIFMAHDLGDRAAAPPALSVADPSMMIYQIEAVDPLDSTQKGWVYLVRSAALDAVTTNDYVSFDQAAHRINSSAYHLGFATPKSWFDYLALGDSNVDILDRSKISAACSLPIVCPLNEEDQANTQDKLIRDGSVRVILWDGTLFAYDRMLSVNLEASIPPIVTVTQARISVDFNVNVSGSRLYTAVAPGGLIVDGTPESMPASPLSLWWQLNTAHGSLIQISDTSALSGTQTNYYVDNASMDSTDTGDQKHYGEIGTMVTNPSGELAYKFILLFPEGSDPGLGSLYTAHLAQPLVITPTLLITKAAQGYFPLVMR